MSSAESGLDRGTAARWWWRGLWLSVVTLFATLSWDAWQRSAPPLVLFFWFTPLLILLPGMARDRLRSVAWLSFVSLLYFVWAILRIFAEPQSPRAQLELAAVIALFLCSMLYLRSRGRELRSRREATENAEE